MDVKCIRFQIIPNMFETFSCNIPEYCKTLVFGGYLFFGALAKLAKM